MLSRRSGLAALGIAALVLSGCTTPDNSPDAYGDATRANFVSSCTGEILRDASDETDTTSAVNLPSESSCVCLYDHFVEKVPFERFAAIDGDLEKDPGTVPAELRAAMDSCAAGPTAPQADASTTSAPPEG